MKIYPLSNDIPGWLLSYAMEQTFFNDIHNTLLAQNIDFIEIKNKKDRVRLYVDIANDLGYQNIVKYNRGKLMFVLDDTPELLLAALKG